MLRTSPSKSQTFFREVPAGSDTLHGELVPRGYKVGVSIYVYYHNKNNSLDSYKYYIHRWKTNKQDVSQQVVD